MADTSTSEALDLVAVNALLAQRAYRPGWWMTAYEGETTHLVLVEIGANVDDSYNPGQQAPLHIVAPVPPYALESELAFDKWLSWRLQQVEIHESQEWYRKRGRDRPWVPVFNPHRDGADRDVWPIVKRG